MILFLLFPWPYEVFLYTRYYPINVVIENNGISSGPANHKASKVDQAHDIGSCMPTAPNSKQLK